jgi:hypothetical protein
MTILQVAAENSVGKRFNRRSTRRLVAREAFAIEHLAWARARRIIVYDGNLLRRPRPCHRTRRGDGKHLSACGY